MTRDFPIEDCAKQAMQRVEELERKGSYCDIYQKWTCKHCGSRQTMDQKNQFFRAGVCEECKQTTMIAKCNYMMNIRIGRKP